MNEYLIKLGIPAVVVAIGVFIAKTYFKEIVGLLPKVAKKIFRVYSWEAKPPLKNPKEVKHISEHLKDINFDIFNGDFVLDEGCQWVTGLDAVIQQMQRFILTERNDPTNPKYIIYSESYGIEASETIFSVKDITEFERQCSNIAVQLLEGFDEWIEVIYSISRKRHCLIIEFKVRGKAETALCKVPDIKWLQKKRKNRVSEQQ